MPHTDRTPRAQNHPVTLALILLASSLSFLPACNRSAPKAASANSGNATASTTAAAPKSINFENPVIQIETSAGTIVLKLDGTRAPGTVRNFLNYATERFYDDTLFHYVDPGKMVVAGGYSAERKSKPGHTAIRNEAHNGLKNTRGTIAMARDPARIDGATSQFFINLADAPQRDHTGDTAATYGYCVFGEVTEGLDVAEKISRAPTSDQGGDLAQTPDPPVVIKSVRIVH